MRSPGCVGVEQGTRFVRVRRQRSLRGAPQAEGAQLNIGREPGLAHQLGGSAAGLVPQEVHLEETVAGVRVSQHHHRAVIVGREDVRDGFGVGDDPGRSQESRELNGVGGGALPCATTMANAIRPITVNTNYGVNRSSRPPFAITSASVNRSGW